MYVRFIFHLILGVLLSNDMQVHFSSASVTWDTPQDFYDKLDKEFTFTLDPCCLPNSAKCSKFFTPEEDGLKQSWIGDTVFMNPPYGRAIKDWVKKAYEESLNPDTTIVCLLPSRTDTKWFNDYILDTKAEIRFVKGRLKFENKSLPEQKSDPAPFPSVVVIFEEKANKGYVGNIKN